MDSKTHVSIVFGWSIMVCLLTTSMSFVTVTITVPQHSDKPDGNISATVALAGPPPVPTPTILEHLSPISNDFGRFEARFAVEAKDKHYTLSFTRHGTHEIRCDKLEERHQGILTNTVYHIAASFSRSAADETVVVFNIPTPVQ